MNIKKTVKYCLTAIWHPIVSIKLWINGSRRFYIAPQISVNTFKGLNLGNDVSIGRNSRFLLLTKYHGGSYQPEIVIEDRVNIGNRFSILSASPIIIKEDCLIASDVLITSENHGIDIEKSNSYADIPLIAEPVTIGKGCWIGEKVSIMPGVSLGDRCIVAANAVVTKSFPEACMIAGIPAKQIKHYDYRTHMWVNG